MMSTLKVAILVDNDYQDQEVWVPLYRLREEGYETIVVGRVAGEYTSKYGYPIRADSAAETIPGRTSQCSMASAEVRSVVAPSPASLNRPASVLIKL